MFEILDNAANANAVIKVVGVGGGGGNAVTHMLRHNVEGVDFIVANTDAQALKKVEAKSILQLGSDLRPWYCSLVGFCRSTFGQIL